MKSATARPSIPADLRAVIVRQLGAALAAAWQGQQTAREATPTHTTRPRPTTERTK